MSARRTALAAAGGIVVGAGLTLCLAAVFAPSAEAPAAQPESTPTAMPSPTSTPLVDEPLPPCATEDSDNCYWDAAEQGDGEGRSFVTINGETTYMDGGTAEQSGGAFVNVEDWPYTTGETLVCGQDAKPAIDHRDDVIGWWAYCEPALVQP